jgi:hypothetical protein
MNINEMTKYLVNVAAAIDNYCKYLNKDTNNYSGPLGYLYRVYQDDIKDISPRGVALILLSLEGIKEEDYGKYIKAFKNKADRVIKRSNSIEQQLEKMDGIKEKVEKE